MICKKCDVEMITTTKVKRRGNETENMPTKHYCPKCNHTEYEND